MSTLPAKVGSRLTRRAGPSGRLRPVPSGGGLYSLELHVIVNSIDGVAPGVYHCAPVVGLLERLRDGPVPSALLSYLFMGLLGLAKGGGERRPGDLCRRGLGQAHHEVCVLDQAGAVLGRRRVPDGIAGLAQLHGLIADHASQPEEVVEASMVEMHARMQMAVLSEIREGGRAERASSGRKWVREVSTLLDAK